MLTITTILEKSLVISLKFNISDYMIQPFQLLDIFSKEMTDVHIETCTCMFIALFIIAKPGNNSDAYQQVIKCWYSVYNIILSNKNEWIIDSCYNMREAQNNCISEGSYIKKDTYSMILFI